MKPKNPLPALILLGVAIWIGVASSGDGTTPPPDADSYTPTAEWQSKVGKIKTLLSGETANERFRTGQFFDAWADAIERNGDVYTTNGLIKTAYQQSFPLAFRGSGLKVANLNSEVDAVLDEFFDVEKSLSDSDREEMVEAFRAVAWACRGGK